METVNIKTVQRDRTQKEIFEKLADEFRIKAIENNDFKIIKVPHYLYQLDDWHDFYIRFSNNPELDIKIDSWRQFQGYAIIENNRDKDKLYYRFEKKGTSLYWDWYSYTYLRHCSWTARLALQKENDNLLKIIYQKELEREIQNKKWKIEAEAKEEDEYLEKINNLLKIKPLDKDLKETFDKISKKEVLMKQIMVDIENLNKI